MAVLISIAPWAGLAVSAWLVVFQVLLAAGAPLGFLAWGGQDMGRLRPQHRVASLASAVMLAVFAAAFGQLAGLWQVWMGTPPRWIFIFCLALFSLSVVGNAASKSRPERLHGVPMTLILVLASGVVVFT